MTGLDWRGCTGATAFSICAAATGVSGCAQTIEQPPPFPEFTQADLDQFDAADTQAPAQAIDDGDRVQNASMLHFLLYQFD
jgi:hypothetical protein